VDFEGETALVTGIGRNLSVALARERRLRAPDACRSSGAVVLKAAVKNLDHQRLAARCVAPLPGERFRAGRSLIDSRSTMT
jgi:hypothetical protein